MRRKGWPEQVYMAREWRTTETLKAGDAIPLAAYGKDVPLEPTYDDAFVELVAWFWTEGGKPRGNSAEFWLNSKAARLLWEVAPGKVVSFEFLLRLTQQQLDLFIEVSMLADNGGERILAQKDIRRTEAFQFACILAGRPTTQTVRPPTTSTAYPMHGVYLKKRQVITPIESAQSGHRRGRGWGIKQELYSGIIWCPRTLNQSWLARRNGTVYFTGNTSAFSQDCDWMFGVEPADDEGIAKVRLITGRRYAKKLIAVKFDWPRGTIEEVQGWDDSDYGDDQMDDA